MSKVWTEAWERTRGWTAGMKPASAHRPSPASSSGSSRYRHDSAFKGTQSLVIKMRNVSNGRSTFQHWTIQWAHRCTLNFLKVFCYFRIQSFHQKKIRTLLGFPTLFLGLRVSKKFQFSFFGMGSKINSPKAIQRKKGLEQSGQYKLEPFWKHGQNLAQKRKPQEGTTLRYEPDKTGANKGVETGKGIGNQTAASFELLQL